MLAFLDIIDNPRMTRPRDDCPSLVINNNSYRVFAFTSKIIKITGGCSLNIERRKFVVCCFSRQRCGFVVSQADLFEVGCAA